MPAVAVGAECWGCGAPPPAVSGVERFGWHSRRVTVAAPSCEPGRPPRRYVMREVNCPDCFAAAGGWYTPPGQVAQEVA